MNALETQYSAPPPRRQRSASRLIALALLLFVGGFVLLNCSGLSFPVWDPAGRLQARLTRDIGFTLPAHVEVERGSRVAYVDPAEGYLLRVPAGGAPSLIDTLQRAARAGPDPGATIETPPIVIALAIRPDWFRPEDLRQLHELRIHLGGERQGGYRIFYSPSDDRVLVFWFET